MTTKDYKTIQDMQLRYDTYVQGRRFDLIVSELLSSQADSFFHDGYGIYASGHNEVVEAFKNIEKIFDQNGGFYRCDLCTSEVISFSPDGRTANGIWLTLGIECKKEAFRIKEAPYPFFKVMGQRSTDFNKEDGSWKIKKTAWRKICDIGPCEYDPMKCTGWSGVRERRWELPPTENCGEWKGDRVR